MQSSQWIKEYEKRQAFWVHDGNVRRPHVCLRSGKHSNGFFNSRPVIAEDDLLKMAACDLCELFQIRGYDHLAIEAIVGPQTGATKLAKLLADDFSALIKRSIALTHQVVFSASPAKYEGADGVITMIFQEKDLILLPEKSALLCEDVISTGGSIGRTVTALENCGGKVLPYVLTLVNRSGLKEIDGRKIVALIDQPMEMWDPDDCPLCKQGSEVIIDDVKDPKNWARLNAKY